MGAKVFALVTTKHFFKQKRFMPNPKSKYALHVVQLNL